MGGTIKVTGREPVTVPCLFPIVTPYVGMAEDLCNVHTPPSHDYSNAYS